MSSSLRAGDRLTGHRVPLHGGPDVGLQPVVEHEIDRGAADLLQLVIESGQPDDAKPAVEVNEKVDVAVGPVFPRAVLPNRRRLLTPCQAAA